LLRQIALPSSHPCHLLLQFLHSLLRACHSLLLLRTLPPCLFQFHLQLHMFALALLERLHISLQYLHLFQCTQRLILCTLLLLLELPHHLGFLLRLLLRQLALTRLGRCLQHSSILFKLAHFSALLLVHLPCALHLVPSAFLLLFHLLFKFSFFVSLLLCSFDKLALSISECLHLLLQLLHLELRALLLYLLLFFSLSRTLTQLCIFSLKLLFLAFDLLRQIALPGFQRLHLLLQPLHPCLRACHSLLLLHTLPPRLFQLHLQHAFRTHVHICQFALALLERLHVSPQLLHLFKCTQRLVFCTLLLLLELPHHLGFLLRLPLRLLL